MNDLLPSPIHGRGSERLHLPPSMRLSRLDLAQCQRLILASLGVAGTGLLALPWFTLLQRISMERRLALAERSGISQAAEQPGLHPAQLYG
ncbi:hypothetical protein [Azotobacter armeniacus]